MTSTRATRTPFRLLSAEARVSERPTSFRLGSPSQRDRDAFDRLLPPIPNRIALLHPRSRLPRPFPAPRCRRYAKDRAFFHDASIRRAVPPDLCAGFSPARDPKYGLRLERHVTLRGRRPAIPGRVSTMRSRSEDRGRRRRGSVTSHTWRRPMTLFLRSAHRAPTPLSEGAEEHPCG